MHKPGKWKPPEGTNLVKLGKILQYYRTEILKIKSCQDFVLELPEDTIGYMTLARMERGINVWGSKYICVFDALRNIAEEKGLIAEIPYKNIQALIEALPDITIPKRRGR